MAKTAEKRTYQPTEARYKGGAQEMYITYDLEQETHGGGHATYPKVKRVYVAGDVKDWHVGDFKRRTGREVHGVKIDYEQSRGGYHREGYTARRGTTTYQVRPADVATTKQRFSQVVEVPEAARNVQFHRGALPEKYREARQAVR
jgi:hypothetical protein